MARKNSISEGVKISIINYLVGKWDECDSPLLTEWLEESDENSKFFSQLIDLWESDKMVQRKNDFNVDKAWNELESELEKKSSPKNHLSIFQQLARYAAIFVLALVIGAIGHSWMQKQIELNFSSSNLVEYTAPYGSKTNLKLLDGSMVWLNAGTTLKYNQEFGTQNRQIELSGEAYFEVAKNKKLPFVVNAKKISVTALGTKFNVKAYPEEQNIETILLEGSVRLQNSKSGNNEGTILKPDQKAIFNPLAKRFLVSEVQDMSEVSWRTEEWVIRNTSLDEFATLLERRYNINIKFQEEKIKDFEFGCTIKDETIEQILTAITLSSPLKYKIASKQVTLSIDESKINQYKTLLK